MPGTTNGGIAMSADTYNEFREKQMDEEKEFLKAKILECNGSISLAADKLGTCRTSRTPSRRTIPKSSSSCS